MCLHYLLPITPPSSGIGYKFMVSVFDKLYSPYVDSRGVSRVDLYSLSYDEDNHYELNIEYNASDTKILADSGVYYQSGFHIYESIEDAQNDSRGSSCKLVRVEYSDANIVGKNRSWKQGNTIVPKQMKILEIIKI